MEILSNIISILCCPECTKPCLKLSERFSHKNGLSSLLVISCECGYKRDFYTSSSCGKSYDINRRTVYTMRACGQGYRGIEKFCALMNMPRPMTNRCYDKIVTTVSNSAQLVAKETMEDAAKEIRNFSDNTEIVDTAVSCDGSWQRRGYSSLNGVVTVISMTTGKVLDCEAMSRYCKMCNIKEKLKKIDPNGYSVWKASHNCQLNYRGSAPGMEVTSAQRIFSRSMEKHKLRYTEFYGDGDSKSHPAVKDIYIYPNITVEKLECVGHAQKRVGTRIYDKMLVICKR